MRAPMGVADALKSVPGFWVEASGGEASANIRAARHPAGRPIRPSPCRKTARRSSADGGLGLSERRPVVPPGRDHRPHRSGARRPLVDLRVRTPPAARSTSSPARAATRRKASPRSRSATTAPSASTCSTAARWAAAATAASVGGFWRDEDGIRDPGASRPTRAISGRVEAGRASSSALRQHRVQPASTWTQQRHPVRRACP